MRQRDIFSRVFPSQSSSDDRYGIYSAISGIAGVSGPLGDPTLGARLMGAVEALFSTYTKPMDPMDFEEFQRDLAAVKTTLPEDKFSRAWSEGQALSQEQAIQAALALVN